MTKALKPIIFYGFKTINRFRIEAFISLENTPFFKL